MSVFAGGSAWAMARDISKGFVIVSDRTFRRMQGSQMDQLALEMNRLLRDVRGQQPDLADTTALRDRNICIRRLTAALSILRGMRSKRRG
ncbi:MAG: hypothetical protein OES47_03510 [Acidobacteriota bacterium]|nr:hypothetical protein [Acidobacteriota bacterium]